MGRSIKSIGTNHGAIKVGLGKPAAMGNIGPGAKQSGTNNGIDTMGTGRKVSFGTTAMVNPHKIVGSKKMGAC